MERFVVHPNSLRRAWWDMTSLLFVIFDMIMIPMQFFDPPDNIFLQMMTWCARIFWTLDIPLSFMTGILKADGSIEVRHALIARNYLTSWFVLDVGIVSCDWLEILFSESATGYAKLGKASRQFRILRMLRLLRVVRMQQVVRLITERIQSEKLAVVADIVKILIIIVGVAHLIACFWYGIGVQDPDAPSWVEENNFRRRPLGDRYTMSLHWSLSQFTGGMDEVTPTTLSERVYAIACYLLAFIMAAVFVSNLTSSMTRLHIIASHHSREISKLRKYLAQNGISQRLALRVQRNARHAFSERQRFMPEANVELLSMVSDPLREEVHFEMYSHELATHPFFRSYIDACPHVMHKVCHRSASTLLVSRGDTIFNVGEIPSPPKMYIVSSGKLDYVSTFGNVHQVLEGQWISEAALWTPWMHRGALSASHDCRLCVIDASKFAEVVSSFDHPKFDPKLYAAAFVGDLNDHDGLVSDLALDHDKRASEAEGKRHSMTMADIAGWLPGMNHHHHHHSKDSLRGSAAFRDNGSERRRST